MSRVASSLGAQGERDDAGRAPDGSAPLLDAQEVSRSFGSTRALADASLRLAPGSIHALAGENGSGKSTLMKILSGVVKPDAGTLLWRDAPVSFSRPRDAQSAGITTVYQETLVVPELSIRDNVFLGTDGLVRRRRSGEQETRDATSLLAQIGLGGLDLDRVAFSLTLAQQQLVTIARALVRPWQLLILDEGTSALDADQRDRLFSYLRMQRDAGRTVLFTSHRMDEIHSLADTVTILRLGETVARLAIADAPPETILRAMAGREAAEAALTSSEGEPGPTAGHGRSRGSAAADQVAARVDDLVLRAGAAPISLEIGRGEIFGLAGLEGQGQAEFSEVLCGLRAPVRGTVIARGADGSERTIRTERDARRWGIGHVPKDRKREGLFFALSTFENLTVSVVPRLNVGGLLRTRALNRTFAEYSELVHLKGSAASGVGTLSGGNQQKVLLARVLATAPKLIVLNDSLRGVDANTKHEVYELLRQLTADGLSVVLLSTEIVELLTICDRIAVFHDGGVSAVLSGDQARETDVVGAMFGHQVEAGTHE